LPLPALMLARIPFEALPDHTQDVDNGGHFVVAEAVQERDEPAPLGAPLCGELGAATRRDQRLQEASILVVGDELDVLGACGFVGERVRYLPAHAEGAREVGDRETVLRTRDRG